MVPPAYVKSYSLSRQHLLFPALLAPVPQQSYLLEHPSLPSSPEVCYVLDDFRVARGWLAVVGGRGQRAGALEPGSFQPHPLHLALLRLRELGRDHDQAEVYHKKGTDLKKHGGHEVFEEVNRP